MSEPRQQHHAVPHPVHLRIRRHRDGMGRIGKVGEGMARVFAAAKHATKALFLRFGLEIRRVGVPGKPVTPGEYRHTMMRYNQIDVVLDVGANTGQYGLQLRAEGY